MIHNASFMEIILLQNGLPSIDLFYIISHNPKNNLFNVPTQSRPSHSKAILNSTIHLRTTLTILSRPSRTSLLPSRPPSRCISLIRHLHFALRSQPSLRAASNFASVRCFMPLQSPLLCRFLLPRYVTLVFTLLMVAWFRFSYYCSLVSSENEVNSCLFKGWLIMPIKCLLKCLCGENKHFFKLACLCILKCA